MEKGPETLKQIPGFSRYYAGSDGRIYSINYNRTGTIKPLKSFDNCRGYHKVTLFADNGMMCLWPVHRFVSLAYLGEQPKGLDVNHKNGVKTDNTPQNLEYCTRSQNVKHAYSIGLAKPVRGSQHGSSKLKEEDVIAIRKHAAEAGKHYGRKALAEKYNISEAHIKAIVNRRTWCHI